MKKRLLLALALLSCSASAFAAAARTSGDNVCVPHQDDDCDASSGSATPPGSRTSNVPATATTSPRTPVPQRRNRTDGSVRNGTMRFQSYLPGMFR
ncbi:hypothetical protein [Solilutibacter silvestris]|uniref:hypothetical protein n=1 Tax=Solilutibacter silvestris TaxID=1645665 RepID=UPI003D33D2CE